MSEFLKRAARIVRGKLLSASGLPGREGESWLEDALNEALDEPPLDPPRRSARDRALAVLEVDGDADADEVRNAYRRLCRRYHPDFFSHDEEKTRVAGELLVEINRAYEQLTKTAR